MDVLTNLRLPCNQYSLVHISGDTIVLLGNYARYDIAMRVKESYTQFLNMDVKMITCKVPFELGVRTVELAETMVEPEEPEIDMEALRASEYMDDASDPDESEVEEGSEEEDVFEYDESRSDIEESDEDTFEYDG